MKTLQEHLEPFIEAKHPEGCICQKDWGPEHSAKYARDYLIEAELTDEKWPAHASDLNCI